MEAGGCAKIGWKDGLTACLSRILMSIPGVGTITATSFATGIEDPGNYEAAGSGADPIDTRPGFAAMLKRIECNGVRKIIVESANRCIGGTIGLGTHVVIGLRRAG